jgi:hypothetical protein
MPRVRRRFKLELFNLFYPVEYIVFRYTVV